LEKRLLALLVPYAPQVGLPWNIKREFWEKIDEIFQEILGVEKLFIRGDLNGHVYKDNNGYERVHEGHRYGVKNDLGNMISTFHITSRSRGYGDVIATYIRRTEIPLHIYAKRQHWQELEYRITWCIIHSNHKEYNYKLS